MSCRTIQRFLFVTGIVLFAVSLALATSPTTVFELEGDVFDNPSIPTADWNTLNGDCTVPGGGSGSPGGSSARTCIGSEDPPAIFTGGGSKDPIDLNKWAWKSATTTPDKDTITHGFSAIYKATDKFVVIGGDRFAVNGDANIGAWLFQNSITLNSNGTFGGLHRNGDVFLVSAFVGGGGTANLAVYVWDTNCAKADKVAAVGNCADANLRTLSLGGDPNTVSITNSAPISNETWSYLAKFGGGTNTIPIGGFFEGGADLTALFTAGGEGNVPCFNSFLLETRSSQATTAVLKDFVLGKLGECSLSLTKSCQCTGFHSDQVLYDYLFGGTVSVSGGTAYNVQVTDKGKTYSCGNLQPGTPKNWPADCTGASPPTFTDSNFPAPDNQASAIGSSDSGGTSNDLTASASAKCDSESPVGACTPKAKLTVDKQCVTTLEAKGGYVVVRVDYTGQVHNTGDVNISSVSVTEDDNADSSVDQTFPVTGTLLRPKNPLDGTESRCYTNNLASCPALVPPVAGTLPLLGVGSYNPDTFTAIANNAGTPITNFGRAQFSDKVRATGTDIYGNPVASHILGDGLSAQCLICPFGFCGQ